MYAVVADTTPIHYLVLIQETHLLPLLFQTIPIPPAVGAELRHPSAPDAVRRWMQSPPAWLEERAIARPPRPEIADLDPGETEAIELALELGAAILLIDEFKGRNIAIDLMLEVRGTLGILVQAAIDGLVDLESALDRLGTTNFRMTSTLRASAMQFHIKRQS